MVVRTLELVEGEERIEFRQVRPANAPPEREALSDLLPLAGQSADNRPRLADHVVVLDAAGGELVVVGWSVMRKGGRGHGVGEASRSGRHY
jgi:hypothetical protein